MWSNNPKCPGGPHLLSTYNDYYDDSYAAKKNVPKFGFEVWCNMPGRYTFFVATGIPTVQLSICSIAVFGTRYIRAQTLTDYFVIQAGTQAVLNVPDVYAEDVIADTLTIDIVQKASSVL